MTATLQRALPGRPLHRDGSLLSLLSGAESSPAPDLQRLTPRSTVLALVPYYDCELWLEDCLASLVEQERPLQGIALIDDASPRIPVDIVRRFPRVTLLRSPRNVGPYRLVQSVIERTAYDAYLFNDADDWSAPRRLAELLEEAGRSGAELVGSHEVRVLCDQGDVIQVAYPPDVNAVLRAQPCAFPLLHPTSLVSRDLVQRVGGFATGMRFSGDVEFLRRAAHRARVRNVPEPLYFRRKRAGALTTSPDTGLDSPARKQVQARLWRQARENAGRVKRGEAPDLAPLLWLPPVPLEHVRGPALRWMREG
jgi:hypothetical protein